MATPQLTEVQQAVINIMDGTHTQADATGIRTVTDSIFVYGGISGETRVNQAKALANSDNYIFDVLFGAMTTHPSSPVSRNASHKIQAVEVSIPVWKHLSATVNEAIRQSDRVSLGEWMDLAIQSLAYPNNMTQDGQSSPTATTIIGGCLMGPGGEGDPIRTEPQEDWDTHLLTASIEASALLKVTQAIS